MMLDGAVARGEPSGLLLAMPVVRMVEVAKEGLGRRSRLEGWSCRGIVQAGAIVACGLSQVGCRSGSNDVDNRVRESNDGGCRVPAIAVHGIGDLDGDLCSEWAVAVAENSSNGMCRSILLAVLDGRLGRSLLRLKVPSGAQVLGVALSGASCTECSDTELLGRVILGSVYRDEIGECFVRLEAVELGEADVRRLCDVPVGLRDWGGGPLRDKATLKLRCVSLEEGRKAILVSVPEGTGSRGFHSGVVLMVDVAMGRVVWTCPNWAGETGLGGSIAVISGESGKRDRRIVLGVDRQGPEGGVASVVAVRSEARRMALSLGQPFEEFGAQAVAATLGGAGGLTAVAVVGVMPGGRSILTSEAMAVFSEEDGMWKRKWCLQELQSGALLFCRARFCKDVDGDGVKDLFVVRGSGCVDHEGIKKGNDTVSLVIVDGGKGIVHQRASRTWPSWLELVDCEIETDIDGDGVQGGIVVGLDRDGKVAVSRFGMWDESPSWTVGLK